MMMQRNVQTLETMRGRYSRAVETAIDPSTITAWDARHVFDCDDGTRLIVARASLTTVTFSVSFAPGSFLYQLVGFGLLGGKDALDIAVKRWREISGDETADVVMSSYTHNKQVPVFFARRPSV